MSNFQCNFDDNQFIMFYRDTDKTEKEKVLYKNDGTEFEYNWQERVIERY